MWIQDKLSFKYLIDELINISCQKNVFSQWHQTNFATFHTLFLSLLDYGDSAIRLVWKAPVGLSVSLRDVRCGLLVFICAAPAGKRLRHATSLPARSSGPQQPRSLRSTSSSADQLLVSETRQSTLEKKPLGRLGDFKPLIKNYSGSVCTCSELNVKRFTSEMYLLTCFNCGNDSRRFSSLNKWKQDSD